MNGDTFREVAVELVNKYGCRDLCEVGVWEGELANMLWPLARTLVLVDPWSAAWNNFDHNGEPYVCTMGRPVKTQRELNGMHANILSSFPGALVLRMPSHQAAEQLPSHCLDFVFIDSVHTRPHCLLDIAAWRVKLRLGGVLAGDDYCGEVKEAVDSALLGVQSFNNVWWCVT